MTLTRGILVAVVAAVLVLPAYLRAYKLSGASDAPTLLLGDTAIVNRAAYWIRIPYTSVKLAHIARPKRGDLVLVRRPDLPVEAFKRVIGLPGETIEIHDNRVTIDGRPLPLRALPPGDFARVPESHRMAKTVYDEDGHWAAFTAGAGQNRDAAAVHLGSDQYYLLGDNRNASLDCRQWGPLPGDSITGKVILALPTGPRKK